MDPTIFSSPRIEAGGGDPIVGFTDDRLDCQTMPLEDYDYAGQSFDEVFTAEQQATLRETFPDGVCDYSKPGKGFQAAVPWLTYQDDQGNVVHGGEPMGAAPVSQPYGPTTPVADTPAADTPAGAQAPARAPLPTTGGGGVGVAVAGLALVGAWALRERRRRVTQV